MADLLPWLRLIGQRRGRLWVGALLIALTIIAGLGLLALSGWFITASAVTGLAFAAGSRVAFDIYLPGGGIRTFALVRTVGRYAERVYNHETVLRLLADLRVSLFRSLARESVMARARQPGASWLSRLTNDLDSLDTLYLRLIAPTGLAIAITSALVVVSGWLYGLQAATVTGVMLAGALILATWGVFQATVRLTRQRVDQLESLRGMTLEHLEGQAELTAASARDEHSRRLLRDAHTSSEDQARVDQRIGWFGAGSSFLMYSAAVAALFTSIGRFQADEISGPVLALLPLAILGLNEVYATLPEAFGRLGGTLAAAHRLNRDIAPRGEPTTCARPPKNGSAPLPDAVLSFRNAGFQHPGLPPVLVGLDLEVKPGERVGLTGRSGCGKSSLADMAAGLAEPTHGKLFRNGYGLQDGNEQWLANVSYLTQSTQLFDDTLRNNLLLADPDATEHDLWNVLDTVCLGDLVKRLPQELDTWLGAYGRQLSGGEARRVALARALLKPADVIVLDEPFTGLDASTRQTVIANLSLRLRGKTLLAFAHAPDALPEVDRVVEL
ncbi:thiol reductant ABC exporter subunit CydC [Marinobacter salicampi]|uniref:thiol reductant ABC exporter subunit CydC n=1 Tax=Marinobacter salicampi TaxID=435907 RepID=UPI00140D98BC|nr:thiol reductant ABC exporter subunit CydC [Marinobacter salicampi]